MTQIPKVGIALAAYQPSPDHLIEQLRSIRGQVYRNWIAVITFDSSIEPYSDLLKSNSLSNDPRFVFAENPVRLGHKKNFERAIQLALRENVDAIACSDQDDIWYPEKLTESVSLLASKGPLSLVHTDMHLLSEGKIAPITAWQIERRGVQNCKPMHLLIRNIVTGASMIFDAELARRFPVIPDETEVHDHWYALIASFFGGVHALRKPMFSYRLHAANVIGSVPYEGLLSNKAKASVDEILRKSKQGWMRSKSLAKAAEKNGLIFPHLLKIIFFSKLDFGFSLAAIGLFHVFSDGPLARACLIRGFGKGLSLLGTGND